MNQQKKNEVQIFKNEEFGQVRTVIINDEPMFCLADVCKALGLEQVSRVKSRLNEDGVTTSKVIDSLGRGQNATFINEQNLYKTIFQSRKESAERFTDWVTGAVLPSIRKNGGYIAGQENMTDLEVLANAALVAQRVVNSLQKRCQVLNGQIVEQKKVISELQPKASYCDLILQSESAVNITQIAQDYGMTATKMNKVLANLKVQRKVGKQWVLYKTYLPEGYVDSETINITRGSGKSDAVMHTKWTQKGRLFLYNILKENGIFPNIEKKIQ